MIGALFAACASMGLGSYLFSLIGAGLYDMEQTKREKSYRQHPYARPYRHRPLISVLVTAENDAMQIGNCLDSLLRSSYKNIEIIIIDHGSTDGTTAVVRRFLAKHPKRAIRLVARHSAAKKEIAAQKALKRYAQGEYILRLGAGHMTDRSAIALAVRRMNVSPDIGRLELQQRTNANVSTAGLLQRYHELLRANLQKSLTHHGTGAYKASMPLMYRRAGESGRTAYAHEVIIHRQTASFAYLLRQDYYYKKAGLQAVLGLTQRAPSRLAATVLGLGLFVGQAALLTLPVFVGYFFYLALHLHEPAFLLLSASILIGILGLAIWSDEGQTSFQKLGYTLLLPITLLVFYFLTLTRLVVLASTIRKA